MKLLLIILFLLIVVPVALTGVSFAVEFSAGDRSVAAFGRCNNGLVQIGAGQAWR